MADVYPSRLEYVSSLEVVDMEERFVAYKADHGGESIYELAVRSMNSFLKWQPR